jgi:chromosome segregation ATPase
VLNGEQYLNRDCRYEFNVWQPDADELQRMRTLEIQYANFSNYINKELLLVQVQRASDLDVYRNWTIMYDKSLMELKTEQLQKYVELQELRVKVGIYEIKLEEMKEKFEDSKYRSATHRSGRKKHVRKDRMLPTYGSQSDTPREQLLDSLKNMVTDLKAEWILLKREFIDMRSDNKNLHRVQNSLYNSSEACHTETSQLRELYRLLGQTDRRIESDIEGIHFKIEHLSQDLKSIKSAQETVKSDVLSTENGLSALQASSIVMSEKLSVIQSQMEPNIQHSHGAVQDSKLGHVEIGKTTNLTPNKTPKGKCLSFSSGRTCYINCL